MTVPSATAVRDPDRLGRVARASGLSMTGAAVAAVVGIAVTALITNSLDVSRAGTVFAATALFLVATGVVQLGTEVGLVKALPTLVETGRVLHARPVVGVAVGVVAVFASVVGTLGWLYSDLVAHLVAPEADPAVLAPQIQVLAVVLPVAGASNALLAATRGLRTMVPTAVVESVGRSLLQLLGVAVVSVLGLGAVATVLAWSLPYAAAAVAAFVWTLTLLRRRAAAVLARDGSHLARGSGGRSVAEFWSFTGPRALATMSQMVLKRADVVLVAALRSPAEAALYAAASRFVVVGQMGVQALQQALAPHLSAMFATDETAEAARTYRAATAWSMLFAWPVYLTCAALAPELLRLFGGGYESAAPVVVLLSLSMLFATACGAVDSVLLMSGHTWLSLINNVGALVLNLVLNFLLIPRYGALGAGVAWSAAIVVRNLVPLVQVWVKHRISPVGRQTGLVALVSVVLFGLTPGVGRWLVDGSLLPVLLVAIGMPVFAAVVWRSRGPLELSAFGGLIRRRRRPAAPAS